jgi:hypothetical protein
LFNNNTPSMNDVVQGELGNCYLHVATAGLAGRNPALLRQRIGDLGDGTFAVQFQRGTTKVFYRVDADLPVYSWNTSKPVYAKLGGGGALWNALLEKAFALHYGTAATYAQIGNGGWMSEAYQALGVSNTDNWTDSFVSPRSMLEAIETRLAAGNAVTVATGEIVGDSGNTLVGGHAYTVVRTVRNSDGSMSIVLRNPWGVDGGNLTSGADDGFVTLGESAFAQYMIAFNAAK